MFIFPADERLFHASLLDGANWYAQQGLPWTSEALRKIHDEKYGTQDKCTICLEQFFENASHHHKSDSAHLFLADGDTPKITMDTKKDWRSLLIQTPMGTYVNFTGLPLELQQEIKDDLDT